MKKQVIHISATEHVSIEADDNSVTIRHYGRMIEIGDGIHIETDVDEVMTLPLPFLQVIENAAKTLAREYLRDRRDRRNEKIHGISHR